jgi:hypothetical protein
MSKENFSTVLDMCSRSWSHAREGSVRLCVRPARHVLLALTAALNLAGCPKDTYDPPAGDTDCVNNSCGPGENFYFCVCGDAAMSPGPSKCKADEVAADSACADWCNAGPGGGGDAEPVSCASNPDSGSCSGWNPASHITLSGGKRYIDDAWISGIYHNPAPIWTCDDLYLTAQPAPGYGFKVNAANSGELLYELGLRNGDVPLSINGKTLKNYKQAQAAFSTLFLAGVTSYNLQVKRGTSTITLLFQLT